MGSDKTRVTAQHRNPEFLRGGILAGGPTFHDLVLTRDHSRPVESQMFCSFDPQLLRMASASEKLDGAHEHLFGNSTGPETGAGKVFLFDNGDFGAQCMCGFHRAQSRGSSADDD